MDKFFRIPFADAGDKTAVPDAIDGLGFVSYTQGYGFDYQRQETDPDAKNIERDKMNQILFSVTKAIRELQSQGVPDFITSALNGGTAFSYDINAVVRYSGALYISLVNANTALPSDRTKWAPFGSFPTVLLPDGYTEIGQTGLILQWGQGSATPSGTINTFPIPFPNAVFVVIPVHKGTDPTVNIVWDSPSLSQFTMRTNFPTTPVSAPYLAIGF